MALRTIVGLVTLAFVTTGCHAVRDQVHETTADCRNRVLAHSAWNEYAECVEGLPHQADFAKGYRDGYCSVLEGGNGCQPSLPPERYWGPCYQTVQGRGRVHAWFDGYVQGALAAQQHGMTNLQEIPVSPTLRANLAARSAAVHALPASYLNPAAVPAEAGPGSGYLDSGAAPELAPAADGPMSPLPDSEASGAADGGATRRDYEQ